MEEKKLSCFYVAQGPRLKSLLMKGAHKLSINCNTVQHILQTAKQSFLSRFQDCFAVYTFYNFRTFNGFTQLILLRKLII